MPRDNVRPPRGQCPWSHGVSGPRSPSQKQVSERLNAPFLAQVRRSRTRYASEAPILVVLESGLVVVRPESRVEIGFESCSVLGLKAAAHAPVAIFLALCDVRGGKIRSSERRFLERASAQIADLRNAFEGAAERPILGAVLEPTEAFIRRVLTEGTASPASLRDFAQSMGASLRRCTKAASRLHLQALDAAVRRALAGLSPAERRSVQIVVLGNHQARAKSLRYQYFARRLRTPARVRSRLTYGEGIESVDEAVSLVATRQMDARIAAAFFEDPRGLDKDVLGDGAAAWLRASHG